MIIYNVTCNVDPSMADEWLQWMLGEHIPEVMGTGCFVEFKVMKLLTQAQDDVGVNYAIQYTSESLEDYERYQEEFGPSLRQKTFERYGESVTAFRSLLEDVAVGS